MYVYPEALSQAAEGSGVKVFCEFGGGGSLGNFQSEERTFCGWGQKVRSNDQKFTESISN